MVFWGDHMVFWGDHMVFWGDHMVFGGGSHGFLGERKEDQSSPTEYKRRGEGGYRKLTALIR